ncbi:eukaryotic translation initiation factor 4E-binding protein [Diorhabda carinulata]|uniref:eukaryotic translation initiation factor 4E-binding protein n=1 Tax=Diorhabda sublineata TaxID=1163346 RepID=UPI0024E04B80|nr:eukaryotic translation initiation factor 4E-binding protein [Diorhabda sublineata]XP_057653205.1 eukaryotic translation initiation factor 4E-binding protein [Diorhabda carinulata]
MSASPIARQAVESQAIPIRRVLINDHSELPAHYSSTPGGTLFSTTPGGTKIVYEKSVLLTLRNSPISKTPPQFEIPDSILGNSNKNTKKTGDQKRPNKARKSKPEINHNSSEDQFDMEL